MREESLLVWWPYAGRLKYVDLLFLKSRLAHDGTAYMGEEESLLV